MSHNNYSFKTRLSGVLLATVLLVAPIVSSADVFSDMAARLAEASASLNNILTSLSGTQQAQVAGTSGALSLAVTSPNGGEVLFVGDTKTITWTSSSVIDKVYIGYSAGPGSLDWIATNIPNTGSYTWNVNVGNTTNTQFKIDISGYQTGTGSVSDQSDNFFSVYSIANKTDLEIFKLCFGKSVVVGDSCAKTDFNADNFVDFLDLGLLKSALKYDMNGDSIIDLRDATDNADLNFVKSCFGQYTASSTSCVKADFDANGFINFADLALFKSAGAKGGANYDLNGDSKVDLRESMTVTAPPTAPPTATLTVALTANPTKITTGQSSTLTLSSTNATSCSGANVTDGKAFGTSVVNPTQTTTYTVTCWEFANNGGISVTTSAVVFVSSDIIAPPNPSPYQLLLDTIGPNPVQAGSDLKIGGGGGTGYGFTNSGNSVLFTKDGRITTLSDVYGFSGQLLTAHLPPGFEPGAYSVSVRTGSGVVSTNSLPVTVIAPPPACATFPCFYDGKSITNNWGTVDSPPEYISAKYPYEFRLNEQLPVTMTLRAQVWANSPVNTMNVKIDGRTVYTTSSQFLQTSPPQEMHIVDMGILSPGVHNLEIYASPDANHFHIDWFNLEKSTTTPIIVPTQTPYQTDLEIFKLCFGKSVVAGDSCAKADFDASGFINNTDLGLLKSALKYDMNGDSIIDLRDATDNADLNFIKSCFLQYTASSMSCAKVDFTGDGIVNIADLASFKSATKYDLNGDSKVDLRESPIVSTTCPSGQVWDGLRSCITSQPTSVPINSLSTLPPVIQPSVIQPSLTQPPVFTERNLYRGMKGDGVRKLQELLARDPQIYPSGQATGYYGFLTQAAVQNFQCKYGLVCDGDPESTGYGVVGPKTMVKINEVAGSMSGSGTGSSGATITPSTSGDTAKTVADYQKQISALLEQLKVLQAQLNSLPR